MRELNYQLTQMMKFNRDGSFQTQAARRYILLQCADDLHNMGYRQLKKSGLRQKHVEALIAQWKGAGLSVATIKNRLAHVRWWAKKIGRDGVVKKGNAAYDIANRRYITNEDKSRTLDSKVDQIRNEYVRLSLRLQAAFGLRREECIKFSPSVADRGDTIVLKASWCKGGRAREIPVRNEAQRLLLDEVHKLAGKGSLIPQNKNYVQQMNIYNAQVKKAGYSKMHGLRHAYAIETFRMLSGREPPCTGGTRLRDMTPDERARDDEIRQIISNDLGHGRLSIVAVYIGS